MSASSTADVSRVTIQMLDGSALGGPMAMRTPIDLSHQIANRRVAAGTTRTFGLTVPFEFFPGTLGANVIVIDAFGVAHSVSARGACP